MLFLWNDFVGGWRWSFALCKKDQKSGVTFLFKGLVVLFFKLRCFASFLQKCIVLLLLWSCEQLEINSQLAFAR